MRIAVCSDEYYPVHDHLVGELTRRGHELSLFGAIPGAAPGGATWADIAHAAAQSVTSGLCEEGIFLCWSGTGIAMAANKLPGIRAALCTDAQTAAAARTWNHANVLALSNRLLTNDLATEILAAWFTTPLDDRGQDGVAALKAIDARYRR